MIQKIKFLLLSGLFGPAIFALVVLLSGSMYPGYDHMNHVISDLGATGSPVQLFMNVFGFMLLGIFIIAFSAGVYGIRKGAFGKLASVLFALGGLAMFLIGVFPSDAPCEEGPRFCPPSTSTAELHNAATYSTFVFLFPAFILLVADTRNEKYMRYYFAVAGILGIIIAYSAYAWFTASTGVLLGMKQRITIAAFFLLLMYTALKLYRLDKKR
ncbi:MAG: DUF998 domain-containing protein [Candidatus Aenigmarchaeota archaeon]|nr:DUF998 domain-containing protein [Candidatus Aenigmarchaeota archaeon]